MNLEYNRQVFREDIAFIYNNIVRRYPARYVTIDGRAVIYMWSSSQMRGDFASLLDEVKAKYPVAFIGSEGIWGPPSDPEDIKRVKVNP